MIIYKATNIKNGKSYIGQTIFTLAARKSQHLSQTKTKTKGVYFHEAIRKYGKENFKWEIITTCTTLNVLNSLEMFFIAYYDTYNNGYNLTFGGNSVKGYKHTEKAKQKISIANKGQNHPMYGKHFSNEVKQKMSFATKGKNNPMYGKHHSKKSKREISEANKNENNPNFGKPRSKETKLKISVAQTGKKNHMFGKHHTKETKRKMSIANKGENNPNAKEVIINGKYYNTIMEAVKKLNIPRYTIYYRLKTKKQGYKYKNE